MTDDRYGDVEADGGMGGFSPSFVDVGGVDTRYYDVGSGAPLVVLHGGSWSGSSSANVWIPVLEGLAEEFRVVAVDRLGCGMTGNPQRPEEYRYRTELDHVLRFLDEMGFDSCHLVGSSRGARLAARVAVEVPERVETLGIVNSSTIGPPVGDYSFRRDRVFERPVQTLHPTDPEYVRQYYEQYCYRTENVTDEFCRTAAYMRSRPKARETAEVMDEAGHREAWMDSLADHMRETRNRLADGVFEGPTLYVLGRNDLNVLLEMGLGAFDTIAQGNPNVRMTIVNQCGHMMYMEYPEEFVRTVVDFVERW